MDSLAVTVPDAVREAAIATLGAYFERICGVDRRVLGSDHVDPDRYLKNIEALDRIVPLKGKKVLEIGSGFGVSLSVMLLRFGADAVGIEPASEGFDSSFHGARAVLLANHLETERLIDACGESLPFGDESFDLVYSNNVLEHTSNPALVLREAARVLKPGGTLYIEVPNYLSYYEGHYLVPQPPILARGMLAWWVKWIFRRDPAFARTLRTEINPLWLRRTLREISRAYPLTASTLGEERFLDRFRRPFEFQTRALSGAASRWIATLQHLNLGNWMGRLIVALKAHYPIVLIATRGDPRG